MCASIRDDIPHRYRQKAPKRSPKSRPSSSRFSFARRCKNANRCSSFSSKILRRHDDVSLLRGGRDRMTASCVFLSLSLYMCTCTQTKEALRSSERLSGLARAMIQIPRKKRERTLFSSRERLFFDLFFVRDFEPALLRVGLPLSSLFSIIKKKERGRNLSRKCACVSNSSLTTACRRSSRPRRSSLKPNDLVRCCLKTAHPFVRFFSFF